MIRWSRCNTLFNSILANTVLLSLHAVNSYILLTANLDDMHTLAKQIAASPVANEFNNIIRRAATVFKETLVHGKIRRNSARKAQMRSDPKLEEEESVSDVGQKQTKEGQPHTNVNQDKVEKTDRNLPNAAEGQKVARSTDTTTENEIQNIEVWKPDQIGKLNRELYALAAELNTSASDSSREFSKETDGLKLQSSSRRDAGFAELGRNASYYLNSIKKIFESL